MNDLLNKNKGMKCLIRLKRNMKKIFRQWKIIFFIIFTISLPYLIFCYPFVKAYIIEINTEEWNQYYEFSLGKNQSKTIYIENPLPAELKYFLWVKLEFIDGGIKIFPNLLQNDDTSIVNREEVFRQESYFGDSTVIDNSCPIKLYVRGYKLENKKYKLVIEEYFVTKDHSEQRMGATSNIRNSAEKMGFTIPALLEKGSYKFKIDDLSPINNCFDEIISTIKISPNTIVR